MLDLPGIAGIRRRLKTPKERDGAELELDFLACAAREGLKPEILDTPDCRVWIGGRPAYVEIRFRHGPVTLRTIHEEARQLSRAEAESEPAIIVLGGPGPVPLLLVQQALRQIPFLSAVVLWPAPLTIVSRTSTLRGMPLRKALRAALDA